MNLTGSCLCGALQWTFDGALESATACNCTACRRFGALWAYDFENEGIKISGPSSVYYREHKKPALGFHFCSKCASVAFWRGCDLQDGKRRVAVNLRLCDQPEQIAQLLIDHFDGLDTFDDLPRDGRCVKDMWF